MTTPKASLRRDKLKLSTVAKMLGYKQNWTLNHGWGTNNDGSDVLLHTVDLTTNKIIPFDPDLDDGHCFRMCLMMGLEPQIDKITQTVTIGYVSPLGNPSEMRSYINSFYGEGDPMPVVRRVALNAAYQLAIETLAKQERERSN